MCTKFGRNRSRRSRVMPEHTHTYIHTSIYIYIDRCRILNYSCWFYKTEYYDVGFRKLKCWGVTRIIKEHSGQPDILAPLKFLTFVPFISPISLHCFFLICYAKLPPPPPRFTSSKRNMLCNCSRLYLNA
jgi:hypothetical protein